MGMNKIIGDLIQGFGLKIAGLVMACVVGSTVYDHLQATLGAASAATKALAGG